MTRRSKVLCPACDTENDGDVSVCSRCGLSLASENQPERRTICPRCQYANKTGIFFCYRCGKYLADTGWPETGEGRGKGRRRKLQPPAPKAKIIMPGGAELILTGDPVFIERADFDSTMPYDILMAISRQHVLITCSRGKYYIQDYGAEGKGSTNHTKLNGVDIYGKKKKALKDGDKIEVAGQPELTMTFRLL